MPAKKNDTLTVNCQKETRYIARWTPPWRKRDLRHMRTL